MAFHFAKPAGFAFKPGQSMNVSLIDPPETDAKGNAPHLLDRQRAARERARDRDAHARHGVQARAEGDARGRARQPCAAQRACSRSIPRTPRPAVFLAGGIGITPFVSMLRDAAHSRPRAGPVAVLLEPASRGRGLSRRARGAARSAIARLSFRRHHGRNGQVEPALERRDRVSRPRHARAPPEEPRRRTSTTSPDPPGLVEAMQKMLIGGRRCRRTRSTPTSSSATRVVPLVPARLASRPGAVCRIRGLRRRLPLRRRRTGAGARTFSSRGNALPERWRGRTSFTIVETGFGLGLNFLATCAAFLADDARRRPVALRLGREASTSRKTTCRGHARALSRARCRCRASSSRRWPLGRSGFHRLHLARGRVTLTLLLGDAQALLLQLEARADAFYLDGFAPERIRRCGRRAIAKELARLASAGATLATWTVAGTVRAALAQAGFARGEARWLRQQARDAVRLVRRRSRRPPRRQSDTWPSSARASQARAAPSGFASRGWEVTLIERHAGPAQGGVRQSDRSPRGRRCTSRTRRSPGSRARRSAMRCGISPRSRGELDLASEWRAAAWRATCGRGTVSHRSPARTDFRRSSRAASTRTKPRALPGERCAGAAGGCLRRAGRSPAALCAANLERPGIRCVFLRWRRAPREDKQYVGASKARTGSSPKRRTSSSPPPCGREHAPAQRRAAADPRARPGELRAAGAKARRPRERRRLRRAQGRRRLRPRCHLPARRSRNGAPRSRPRQQPRPRRIPTAGVHRWARPGAHRRSRRIPRDYTGPAADLRQADGPCRCARGARSGCERGAVGAAVRGAAGVVDGGVRRCR